MLAHLARPPARGALVCTAHGWIVNTTREQVYRFSTRRCCVLRRRLFVSARHAPARAALVAARVSEPAVLHNGSCSTNTAKRRCRRRAGRWTRKKVTLLNVGRLSPEKGQDLLLEAMAPLASRHPGLTLQFAGTGPEEARLRALAQSLGIGDRVQFLGYIHDMPSLYADVDLLVQSSLTEGLPNVIVEAAYLRVPILATRVGGTAEVVEHGKSGWLIPAGDVNAIRAGLEAFLGNPQSFVAMGESAQRRIVDGFSIAVRTRKLTEFYRRLCARKPR